MENKVTRREYIKNDDIEISIFEQPIEFFENLVKQCKQLGATHINIEIDSSWDSSEVYSITFEPYKIFFETDEEKEIRLKKEQQEKENKELEANRKKEEFERNLLRQLKEKYEL